MMKSFLKKLAFVMALTMVVTTAAPAAGVFAAEAGVTDETKAVVTEKTLAVGETHDFGFAGCDTWAEAKVSGDWGWTSDKEEVATVNYKGEVTGVADGVATITIKVGATYEKSVVVTVGEGEKVEEVADASFEAVQVSDTVAKLTFANKEITADEVKALEFYYYIGETKVTYPIQIKEVKEGVVTVESYVYFVDGTKYGFKLGEETDEFDAVVGDVAEIQCAWSCLDDEFKAYVGYDTVITYKLLNGKGIDITNSAKNAGGSVTFSLVTDATNGEFWISDASGKVFFNEKNAAAQVKLEYITGKYDETTYEPIKGPDVTVSLVSSDAPAFGVDVAKGVKAATITTGTPNWNSTTNIIALGDDNGHKLVVKMTDTQGDDILTTSTSKTVGATTQNYSFSFASTNNAVLYVAEDGTLMTNGTGLVNVLVYFQVAGSTAKNVVAVVPVDVRAARAVSSVTPSKASDVVSTMAGNDGKDYNKTTFKFTLKDQLGSKIDAWASEVKCNNTNLPNGATAAPTATIARTAKGEYTVTVTGDAANLPTNANGYTYSFTAKFNNAFTQTFSVTVRKPIIDNGAYVVSGYKVEFSGDNNLKTTDTAAKAATATLYILSNGVKADVAKLNLKPASVSAMKVGEYYYTISKGGNALAIDNGAAETVSIPLTKIEKNNVATTAAHYVDIVNKTANGEGTYTIVVYKGVGTTVGATASTFTQVTSNTVTVSDSQDKMVYAGKAANSFTSVTGNVVELVKDCFNFKLGNTVLTTAADGTDNYGSIIVVPNANQVVANGALKPGSVCFVKSVDFYVPTDSSCTVYVKYTVNVNDYVEIK